MRPPLSYVPLLPAFVMLAAGIVVSRVAADGVWLFVVAMAFGSVAMLLLSRRYAAVLTAAAGLGSLVGATDAEIHRAVMPPAGVHRVAGVVTEVTEGNASERYIVALSDPYGGNCYVTVPGFGPTVKAGDRIVFDARFEGLGDHRDVEGDIDLTDFYYRRHIAGRASVLHDSLWVTGAEPGLIWSLRRQCDRVTDSIACSGLSPRAQELVAALLTGDDSLLDNGMRPSYAGAGIAHVLALSGMHVAVIAAMLSWLLFPLSWAGYRKLRWVLVAAVLWGYALFTGLSPSVTRAVCMFTLMLAAKCMGRHYSSANALFFAAIAILIFTPRQLFSPGFQLSFMAVLALITVPAAFPQITTRRRGWRLIRNYFVYSLAAVLGTLPLAAYYFHLFPVYFLIANVPCSVALPAIIVCGALVLVLQLLGLHCEALDLIVDTLCDLMTKTATAIAGAPHATVDGIYMPGWCVAAIYVAIALAVAFVCYRRVWMAAAAVSAVIVSVVACIRYGDVPDTLFVGRNAEATDVIIVRNRTAELLTTVPGRSVGDETAYVLDRYGEFFGRRGIDSLAAVAVGNAVVSLGGKSVVIVNSDEEPAPGMRGDYLIVCRGFRDDVTDLAASVKCDSILLGTDMNARRRRRYEAELHDAGYAVRSLADGAYGLVIESSE